MKKPINVLLAVLAICGVFALTTSAQASILACDWSGDLFSVNTADATLSYIGSTGLGNLGTIEYAADGTLYGITAGSSSGLYRIDPTTAAATFVGSLGIGFVMEGGLAFGPDGTAYGAHYAASAGRALFSIDLNNGAATEIGLIGDGFTDVNGLAWRNDGTLIGVDEFDGTIIEIDPTSGAASTLSTLGFSCSAIGGMTTDPLTGISYLATGRVSDNNGNPGTNSLYTLDLNTGGVGLIGQFSYAGGWSDDGISGLAAKAVVPEPATIMLLGIGLAGFGVMRRRLSK